MWVEISPTDFFFYVPCIAVDKIYQTSPPTNKRTNQRTNERTTGRLSWECVAQEALSWGGALDAELRRAATTLSLSQIVQRYHVKGFNLVDAPRATRLLRFGKTYMKDSQLRAARLSAASREVTGAGGSTRLDMERIHMRYLCVPLNLVAVCCPHTRAPFAARFFGGSLF